MERTSEEKLFGGLTHLAIFLSWLGLIANLILYYFYRPKSQFVAGHVKQALALQVTVLVIGAILGLLFGVGALGGFGLGSGVGMAAALGTAAIGGLIWLLLAITGIALAIFGAVKGFQGQEHRHPIIGNWAAGLGE